MFVELKRLVLVYLVAVVVVATANALPRAEIAPAEKPRLILNIPRISQAPTLQDFLEMRPSSRVSGRMLKVDGFVQHEPMEGAEPTQRTEAYLAYDDKHLYVAFIAFDTEPQKIRARLSRREDVWSDDTVEVMLDTFHDERRAYVFVSTPLGIQWDGNWIEGRDFDSSFDSVWHSQGKVTERGYVVLMTIPFRSLRFPSNPQQSWGIILNRSIARRSEDLFVPALSARIEGRLNQQAVMRGLENVSPGRNMQFTPYTVMRSARSVDDSDGYRFKNEGIAADLGLDSKIVLKDSLVLDTTLNPDFSQVESDDPQVTVNQRFEVFFPEKRPFFLENTSFFQTPLNLVFTRRIADPTFGSRLSGKIGDYSIGALFADDTSAGQVVEPDDPGYGRRAHYGIVRVNRDILNQSSIGLIYTDREFGGGYNRVGGIDTRLKLTPNWVASGQAATSATLETDGTRSAGPAYTFEVGRAGRNLSFGSEYYHVSKGFLSKPGYVTRTDLTRVEQWGRYRFRPESGPLISWGPSINLSRAWDAEGTRLDYRLNSDFRWTFRGNSEFGLVYNRNDEQLRPVDFDTLTEVKAYPNYSTGFWARWGQLDKVTVSTGYRWERRINYVPVSGPPQSAGGNSGNFSVTLRPITPLRVSNSYQFNRVSVLESDENAFSSHIIRSNWNWQFTKTLSLRLIGTYNSVLANPRYTSLSTTKRLNADVLIAYLLHPGTAVYVGYNSNLQNLYPDLRSDADGNLLRTRDRFINDGRQVFIKMSYLFRF